MIILDTDHFNVLQIGKGMAYDALAARMDASPDQDILRFSERAASTFGELRQQRVRIGSLDLKIASIALEHGATLLSANARDFDHIPGLRFEDWLHSAG